MSENPESAAQQHDNSTPKPPVEREVGQYSGGDYGEGGTVSQDQAGPEAGGYAGGDYGEGGTVGEDQSGPESGGYAEGVYGEGGTVGDQAGPATGGYAEGDYGEGETGAPVAVETVRWTLRLQFLAPLTTIRKARAGKPDSFTADPARW